jgi:hypothetical protein
VQVCNKGVVRLDESRQKLNRLMAVSPRLAQLNAQPALFAKCYFMIDTKVSHDTFVQLFGSNDSGVIA